MAAKTVKLVVAALAAVAVVAGSVLGWQWWQQRQAGELGSAAEIGSEQAFAFGDCRARMFDGSPAIAMPCADKPPIFLPPNPVPMAGEPGNSCDARRNCAAVTFATGVPLSTPTFSRGSTT